MYTEIEMQEDAVGSPEKRLREEIEMLEGRLRAMGVGGDCAYERAMSSLYQRLLEDLKIKLACRFPGVRRLQA